MVCYGSGLRISEAVSLRVSDIDSKRMPILVQDGKGGKDRYTVLGDRLLGVLRAYWKTHRSTYWRFPGFQAGTHVQPGTIQQSCREAARKAGFIQRVTPHPLRHSFATHRLENGTDTRAIQVLPGPSRIDTTARYTRVTPQAVARIVSPLDTAPKKRGRPRKVKTETAG
jgi:integrase/recombinase XerD